MFWCCLVDGEGSFSMMLSQKYDTAAVRHVITNRVDAVDFAEAVIFIGYFSFHPIFCMRPIL